MRFIIIIVIKIIYSFFSIIIAVFFTYLALLAIAAIVRGRKRSPSPSRVGLPPRLAIVVPAHDEQDGIVATIASCQRAEYDRTRFTVFVVADNCADATAARARTAGATVIERHDAQRRSKGHALEFFFDEALDAWRDGQFDAVVIIDADTRIDPSLLRVCADALGKGHDWGQAYYTVSNPDTNWRTRLMTYALGLYNGLLPLGQECLGLSVGLRGNGMLFSAHGLSRFPWRAHGLVEDAEFGLMLKAAGERVHFLVDARVHGEMVSSGDRAVSQRRRWEAGRRTLRAQFTTTLARSPQLGLARAALYLIDLYLPPLVTLVLGFAGTLSVHILAWPWAELRPFSRYLASVHLLMGLGCLVYVVGPCLALGMPLRYLGSLLHLPRYAFWKWSHVGKKVPDSWVRTGREVPRE